MDLAQTMIEALGGTPLLQADGRSFLHQLHDPDAPWTDEILAEYCTDHIPAWTGGEAVRQRMIRQGPWKLNYYRGYRPQLFNLADDPDEVRDLAPDPAHAEIVDALVERVLDGWDSDEIDRRLRRERKDLLGAWARSVRPDEQYRWQLRAEMNRLDSPAD